MTLRSSDLQSDSDLDSICNYCGVFKWKGNFTQLHMKYGSPGPAHSSESPFSLSWILKGVYLGRVLQNPPFHKLDLTRLYLYWSIILSLSSVSMKKEGAFICKRLYFCKTKIVPFYLFFLVFLVLPLGMCTSSNHGDCQGSGRSLWVEHLLWKMLEKFCSNCFCHLEKN